MAKIVSAALASCARRRTAGPRRRTGGPVRWVRGTITIPGVDGGSTTIRIDAEQLLGRHVGRIVVQDPRAHLAFTALLVAGTLHRPPRHRHPRPHVRRTGQRGRLTGGVGLPWRLARNHDRRRRRREGGRQRHPYRPRDNGSDQLTVALWARAHPVGVGVA